MKLDNGIISRLAAVLRRAILDTMTAAAPELVHLTHQRTPRGTLTVGSSGSSAGSSTVTGAETEIETTWFDHKELLAIFSHFNAPEVRGEVVAAPTLLFHFNRRNLERMLEIVTERSSLLTWRGYDEVNPALTPEDLRKIHSLTPMECSDLRKRALERGIGIHSRSAKESYKYLRLVEELFQDRKLKVRIKSLAYRRDKYKRSIVERLVGISNSRHLRLLYVYVYVYMCVLHTVCLCDRQSGVGYQHAL
jgi:hypothetical protein